MCNAPRLIARWEGSLVGVGRGLVRSTVERFVARISSRIGIHALLVSLAPRTLLRKRKKVPTAVRYRVTKLAGSGTMIPSLLMIPKWRLHHRGRST